MFKWVCLGVAVVFLAVLGWMINDIRLQLRHSARVVDDAGQNVNEHLPVIVERSLKATDLLARDLPVIVERAQKSTDVVARDLPEIVERVNRATEVIAELSEDIRQLKELAGVTNTVRDKNLVAYTDSILTLIENSGGTIGVKKTVGQGLKNTQPAREWVVGARKEALFLTLLVKSKKEMVKRLCRTKFGFAWYIQIGDEEPIPLAEWVESRKHESSDPSE
jgi:hypothetical protein